MDAALRQMLVDRTLEPNDVVGILFVERDLRLTWWQRRVREEGGWLRAFLWVVVEYVFG